MTGPLLVPACAGVVTGLAGSNREAMSCMEASSATRSRRPCCSMRAISLRLSACISLICSRITLVGVDTLASAVQTTECPGVGKGGRYTAASTLLTAGICVEVVGTGEPGMVPNKSPMSVSSSEDNWSRAIRLTVPPAGIRKSESLEHPGTFLVERRGLLVASGAAIWRLRECGHLEPVGETCLTPHALHIRAFPLEDLLALLAGAIFPLTKRAKSRELPVMSPSEKLRYLFS